MHTLKDALIIAIDCAEKGEIAHDKRNTYVVQLVGVYVTSDRMPRDVRRELNASVRAGEIGHIAKDGLRPECYHHKNARANALEVRNRIALDAVKAISTVCGINPEATP